MTDSTYTALLLVSDRGGSMHSIRNDMVGGLTTTLADTDGLRRVAESDLSAD
jgi:hypothetical protein